MLFLSFLLACFISFAVATKQINDWPIIGVFSQPSTSKEGNCNGNCMYIAASYVKYLEAAGARVVPINYSATNAELDVIFQSINGLFFPGGGAVFPKSAQYMFDKVVAANQAGDYFPLWGTCMGFQWLLISATRNPNVLDPSNGQMDSYNYSIPLDFTAAAPSSRLFAHAGRVYDILAKENVTMNNHHYGIYPEHFAKEPALTDMFQVLSNNNDRQGVPFVSTIEAFKYPIYGSQWHPEKNDFEYVLCVFLYFCRRSRLRFCEGRASTVYWCFFYV
jgi:gamma-glutamyl hydrolase